MKPITLNIPEGLLKSLDRLVEEDYYPNRAEAIRCAIKVLIDQHENFRKMGARRENEG